MSFAVNRDFFWSEVRRTPTFYRPESAVIVQGKKKAENAKELQMSMFSVCMQMYHACNVTDPFAQRLFSKPPERVLDLGAGIGAHTLPMAQSGAHVTAIDQSREFLRDFSRRSVTVMCPKERLRLRCGDITTMGSYDGPFDLVVAIDILPYVSPTELRSTMEKIQKCLTDRGSLIGTIFTTDDPPLERELMGQLGAHFYQGGKEFVEQLLQYSGFKVLELEVRSESTKGEFRFLAEKTPVEK